MLSLPWGVGSLLGWVGRETGLVHAACWPFCGIASSCLQAYTRVPGGGVCCGVQVCVGVYRPGTCAHSQVWALGHRCPLCPAPCRVSPPPMAHTETLKNDHSPSLQRSSAPLPGQRSLSFEEMLGGQVWTGMRLWHGQQGHGHPSVNPCDPHPQAPGTMPHTELKASLSGAGARHSRRGAVGGACT